MNQDNTDLIFKIDKSFNITIIFCLIFFGGGLLVSIMLLFLVPALMAIWFIWIPVIIGYLIFLKYFLGVWKQRKNYVTLNDSAISLHLPENKSIKIRWNEITDVKENNILERLTIKDINGQTLRLEYQLEDMTELLNLVSKNIPQLTKQFSQLRQFHRTNHLHTFFGIFLLLISTMAIYSWYSGVIFPAIVLSIFSLLIVYLLLIEFIGVRILDDSVSIIYPLRKKEIKYSQIKNIVFENIRGGNGKSSPFVIIRLLNDKKIKLNALREGTIALFSAINSSFSERGS